MTKQYKLGKTTWKETKEIGIFEHKPTGLWLPIQLLLDMGATPIDDKPEDEWSYTSHHGAYSLGIEPKGNGLISEKIDSNPQPVKEIELICDAKPTNYQLSVKLNQVIRAVNSLKGE
jgi:hypothetical protein